MGVREEVTGITIKDPDMAVSTGYLVPILKKLGELELNVLHLPTGESELTLYIANDSYEGRLLPHDIIYELVRDALKPSATIENVDYGSSIIGMVGEGMNGRLEHKIKSVLIDNKINVSHINNGSEVSVYYLVPREDLKIAVKLLYNSFFRN